MVGKTDFITAGRQIDAEFAILSDHAREKIKGLLLSCMEHAASSSRPCRAVVQRERISAVIAALRDGFGRPGTMEEWAKSILEAADHAQKMAELESTVER